MTKPAQPHCPRPWIVIWRMNYPGAFPTRLQCHACDLGYRPQSIGTAAKFLRQHRHCGAGWLYEKVRYI